LPPDLKVGGDLDLTGTQVREIPPDAKIGDTIFGVPKGLAEKYFKRKGESYRNR
jgi:hypothetical protein